MYYDSMYAIINCVYLQARDEVGMDMGAIDGTQRDQGLDVELLGA